MVRAESRTSYRRNAFLDLHFPAHIVPPMIWEMKAVIKFNGQQLYLAFQPTLPGIMTM
jgi:hypothetical protein